MPSQHIKKKRTSVLYQPRKMMLDKNKRIHVLGMSLSHLNISISYKYRIKALLANNKALAHALAQAQHEISIKDKEIFDLKCRQSLSNIPKLVKSKLHGICEHMDVMVNLLQDALSACNSEDLVSSRSPLPEAAQSCSLDNVGTPYLPSQKISNVAQLGAREEGWLNNMTTIEEQSISETENLPPILFTNESATKQYKKVLSRSKSRSLLEDVCSRPDRHSKESVYESCSSQNDSQYIPVNPDMEPNNSLLSDIGQISQLPPDISNVSSEKGNTVLECLCIPVPNTVPRSWSSEGKKESYDSDIAIRLDPQMLSQAMQGVSHVTCEQVVCSPCGFQEPFNPKPSLTVGFGTESKPDPVHDSGNAKIDYINAATDTDRTSNILMDMELTGTVSQSVIASIQSSGPLLKDVPVPTSKDLSNEDEKVNRKVKKLSKKIAELSQSFIESSDKSDPDYKPRKEAKKARKAKKENVPSVRKGGNPSFKVFSTSPKPRKRKGPKIATKASKKTSKTCEVSVKRDINEYPSAVFDFSLGDSLIRTVVEPYKALNKSPLPKKQTDVPQRRSKLQLRKGKPVQPQALERQETKDNLCKYVSPKQNSETLSPQAERKVLRSRGNELDLPVPNVLCGNSNSALEIRLSSTSSRRKKSSKKEGMLADPINTRISGRNSSPRKENFTSPRQSMDHDCDCESERRRSRRQPVSYKEPALNKKMRRE